MNRWFLFCSCLLATCGCQSLGPNANQAGLFGTAGGALVGAAIGANEGKSLEGAAIGALTGGTIGTIAGNQVDRENQRISDVQQASYQKAVDRALTLEQIVQMTRSGLSDQVIVNQVRSVGIMAPLNSEQLVWLKNNGVSDPVISALQTTPPIGDRGSMARSNVGPRVYEEYIHVNPPPFYGPAPFCRPHRPGPCGFVPYRYHPGPRRSSAGFSVRF